MREKLIKALWLLVTLDLVLVGICPLAPTASLTQPHKPHCQHERVPAPSPHSCCVSVHHQPALVRPMLENFLVLSPPAVASKPLLEGAQISRIGKIALAPSPPLLTSALRI